MKMKQEIIYLLFITLVMIMAKYNDMGMLNKLFENEWQIHDNYERHVAYRSILILGFSLGIVMGLVIGLVLGLMA